MQRSLSGSLSYGQTRSSRSFSPIFCSPYSFLLVLRATFTIDTCHDPAWQGPLYGLMAMMSVWVDGELGFSLSEECKFLLLWSGGPEEYHRSPEDALPYCFWANNDQCANISEPDGDGHYQKMASFDLQ